MEVADNVISTAWLDSCEKVIKVSANLDNNLKYYRKKNLETTKFQYYTSLHFRSMIAADIAYKHYKEIKENIKAIGQVISNVEKGNKKIGVSVKQLKKARN